MSQMITKFALLLLLGLPSTGLAALDEIFVSSAWLAENRLQVVVVDVRKSPFYLLGHIADAHHVPRNQFLQTRGGVKSLVPGTADMEALLGRLGVTPETAVVAYAEDDNPYAARFVWSLRYHGHERAYVLDGGYDKWSAEDRPTSLLPSTTPVPAVYRFPASARPLDVRAEADALYTRLAHPATAIWDTRRRSEHLGSEVRAERGGHIPGAVHLDWTELQKEVDGVKVLKSRAEISALLEAAGLTPDREIIAHCQTGIRSSYATLVLLGLGYPQAKNYDGSWIEWANDPTRPIINADGARQEPQQLGMN